MLVEFCLKNYCCFRDEQTLSLVASSDNSLPDNVIETDPAKPKRLRLLRSVVVYGPNASGKTKLLDAMHFAGMLVVSSASEKPGKELDNQPFRLDNTTRGQPSEFEFTFIYEGVRYQYGFAVDQKRVHREYLYASPHGVSVLYFDRSLDEDGATETYKFGPSLKGQNKQISEVTRSNALFLSAAATFKHPMLIAPYTWFEDKLEGTQGHLAFLGGGFDEDFHAQISALLRMGDVGISDYVITEIPATPRDVSEGQTRRGRRLTKKNAEGDKVDIIVEMLHSTPGGESVGLRLDDESYGTIGLFFSATPLLRALNQGQVLFVDELDASKHPLLVRALVELFHNPEINKKNAQLIFNTHDTSLLDQTLFRRDQIWFTEKDGTGTSHLYSLLEYSPRKSESLAKGYLQGRYGAIPFLGDPSLLNEEKCV
jgi:AAA15 family ATPase/GTPase